MKVLIILAAIALTGCYTANYNDTTGSYKLPKELNDCKVYSLQGEGSSPAITVVRCPTDTSTSYRTGKILRSVSVN